MKLILDIGPFPSTPWVYSQLSNSLDSLYYGRGGGGGGDGGEVFLPL